MSKGTKARKKLEKENRKQARRDEKYATIHRNDEQNRDYQLSLEEKKPKLSGAQERKLALENLTSEQLSRLVMGKCTNSEMYAKHLTGESRWDHGVSVSESEFAYSGVYLGCGLIIREKGGLEYHLGFQVIDEQLKPRVRVHYVIRADGNEIEGLKTKDINPKKLNSATLAKMLK